MAAETLNSPNEIEVLLHCHCCPEPHPRQGAPAVKAAIRKLLECGALEAVCVPPDYPPYYTTTELGHAWVEALKRVPIPKKVYLDERGNIIDLRSRKAAPARRRDG